MLTLQINSNINGSMSLPLFYKMQTNSDTHYVQYDVPKCFGTVIFGPEISIFKVEVFWNNTYYWLLFKIIAHKK